MIKKSSVHKKNVRFRVFAGEYFVSVAAFRPPERIGDLVVLARGGDREVFHDVQSYLENRVAAATPTRARVKHAQTH
jgi:hypothetical protein